VVVHTYNPSTLEAVAGGSPNCFIKYYQKYWEGDSVTALHLFLLCSKKEKHAIIHDLPTRT
jgi:hypothetical protein